ncbi:MAG: sigma-70 family RNA polymerase sigma factor [Clostridiaceae bacterium]
MDHKLMEELLIRAKDGDNSAVLELLEEFTPFILNCARKIYIQNWDFEDMAQLGRLSFLKAIDMYDTSVTFCFPAYAVNAVRKNYYNEIRKAASRDYVLDMDRLYSLPSAENTEEVLIRKETVTQLNKCLELLSADEKALIDWYYFRGLSIKEYANILGLPYNLLVKRKQRILQRLKNMMLSG